MFIRILHFRARKRLTSEELEWFLNEDPDFMKDVGSISDDDTDDEEEVITQSDHNTESEQDEFDKMKIVTVSQVVLVTGSWEGTKQLFG